jgi:tetratricopeptide (TPR) repeat protein
MKEFLLLFLVLVGFLFTVFAYCEDAVKILDGGIVRGEIIDETEDYILIRRKSGDIQQLSKERIESIERGPSFNEEFERRWKSLNERDVDGFFELGIWAEDRGRRTEAEKCYKRVIALNPDHEGARERLGHKKYKDKWYTNDDDYYKAMGMVKFGDLWVTPDEKEKYEAGFVKLPDGTWIKREELKKRTENVPAETDTTKPKQGTPTRKESWRRQVRDDEFYKDSSGSVPWNQRITIDTGNYILETDLGEKQRKFYAQLLEKLHAEYKKMFGEAKMKCRVLIYSSHQEFMQLEGRPPGVGGYYGGGRVVAFHGLFGPTGSTQTVLAHECTHQFHDMVAGIRKAPIWFTEGLSTFFECSEFDENNKLHIGIVNNDRLKTVQEEVKAGRGMSLEELLTTPQARYGGRHYAYGWSFMYMIGYGTKGLRKIFEQYWSRAVGPGGSGDNARSDAFRKIVEELGYSIDELQEFWHSWVMTLDPKDYPSEAREKSLKFEAEWKWKSKKR